jgi:hypothetical protein
LLRVAIAGFQAGRIDRVFFEQFGDHGRVEISPNAHDPSTFENNNPAIVIVELHAIPGNRQRSQFDRSLVTIDNQVFQMKLRAQSQHMAQFGERARD